MPTPLFSWIRQRALLRAVALSFSLGVVATGIASWELDRRNATLVEEQLTRQLSIIQQRLLDRLRAYAIGLGSLRAFIYAVGENELSKERFRAFVLARDLTREFPGNRGWGFVQLVPETSEEEFVRQVRARDFPDFEIQAFAHHSGNRHVVLYLEPLEANASAIGIDQASEDRRRMAALSAARTGEVILSAPITLVQTPSQINNSFLLYLPVYENGKFSPTGLGPTDRVSGWVYSPLVMPEILVLAEQEAKTLHLAMWDVTDPGQKDLIYENAAGTPSSLYPSLLREIDVYGRRWLVEISPNPAFIGALRQTSPYSVFIVGLALSFLAALLVAILSNERNKKLSEQNLRLRERDILLACAKISETAGTVEDVIQKTLDLICSFGRWPLGHAYALRDDVAILEPMPIWSDTSRGAYDDFRRATMETKFGPGEGLPGQVWVERRPVSTALSNIDQGFARASALPQGVTHTALAVPVFIRHSVGVVLEFFAPHSHELDRELLNILGNVGRVIGDIVTRKSADALVLSAAKSKSEFFASMSHEIRTPLNGIIGNLELLGFTDPNAEQAQLIESANNSSKALLALIGNVLDFSKIEAGKMTIEMGDANPVDIVNNVVSILRYPAQTAGLFISLWVSKDVPLVIRTDAARLRQVLLNLVGNAIKFTATGGISIQLTVESWKEDVAELQFSVCDSGRGIGPESAAGLFSPYTQERTSDAVQGTGLGLAICKSIAELMGGRIGCEGRIDQGAIFWISIPVKVVRQAREPNRLILTNKSVLLVGPSLGEDSEMARYFRDRGAKLTHAKTVKNARECLAQYEVSEGIYSICVVDCAAEGANTSELGRDFSRRGIAPLIYLNTPSFSLQERMRWMREGFEGILTPNADEDSQDANLPLFIASHASQPAGALAKGERAAPATPEKGNYLEGKRILVLEDNVMNQMVISRQLKRLKIDFVISDDGLEGLVEISRDSFDLVLCDCSMPRMDGFEFTRQVRKLEAEEKRSRLTIIALTANAFTEDRDRCLEVGMDDFLSKPIAFEHLAKTLSRWVKPAQNQH